jgi:hypothetical protein
MAGFSVLLFISTYLVLQHPGMLVHVLVQQSFLQSLPVHDAHVQEVQTQLLPIEHVLPFLVVIPVLANTTALATNNVAIMPKPIFFIIVFLFKV